MDDEIQQRNMTIRDAAIASGVDRRTLQQHVRDGIFPNAFRKESAQGSATGPWFIPISDLAAAGIDLDETRVQPVPSPATSGLQAEIDALRAELAEERTLRRVAEALSAERAAALEHARVALKALESLADAVPAHERAPGRPVNEPARPRPRGQWLR
jgi:hypothetical protein